MTNKLTKLLRNGKVWMLALAFSLPVLASAQFPGDPGDDPDPTPVPFDGGIGILVAAGAAYAIKKRRDQKSKQQKDSNSL